MPVTEKIFNEELNKEYEVIAELPTRVHDMITRAQKVMKIKGKKGEKKEEGEEDDIEMDSSSLVDMKRILITQLVVNPKITPEVYDEMPAKETQYLFAYLQDKLPKATSIDDLKKKVVKR